MRKVTGFLIVIGFILSFMMMPVSAAESGKRVEFVILLDVSPSMGKVGSSQGNDPERKRDDGTLTRISIQAIRLFAELSFARTADVSLSLIVYHDNYLTVFDNFDFKTNDTDFIERKLQEIIRGRVTNREGTKSMETYNVGYTDFSEPLKEAQRILNLTPHDENVQKGVLLFTDGAIQLRPPPNESTPEYQEAVKAVKEKCREAVRDFEQHGINFYPIGLKGPGYIFDEEFLHELAGIHRKQADIADLMTGGDLNEILKYFTDTFQNLLGIPQGSDKEGNLDQYNNFTHAQHINIYGEITREVTIVITKNSELEYISVLEPGNGNPVYDSRHDDNSPNIIVYQNLNFATIRILDPQADGNWEIKFKGTMMDTLRIQDIHFHEMSLKYEHKPGNKFDIFLFNNSPNKDSRVTLPRIYEDVEFYYRLIHTGDHRTIISGKDNINETGDGYDVSISNLSPGEYKLEISISLEGHFAYTESIIIIEEKTVKLSTNKTIDSTMLIGTEIIFYAELFDEYGTAIPPDPNWKATLHIGEENYEMALSEVHYEYSKKFDTIGNYSIDTSINLIVYEQISETVNFTIFPLSLPEADITPNGINFFMHPQDDKNNITSYSVYISDDKEILENVLINGVYINTDYENFIIYKEDIEIYANPDNADQIYSFFEKQDILYTFNKDKTTQLKDLHLYYAVKEVINGINIYDISDIKDFSKWIEIPVLSICVLLIIAILGIIMGLSFKKVTHLITIGNDEYSVNHKNPLLIATYVPDNSDTLHFEDCGGKDSFKNKKLAKIYAVFNIIPLPRFFTKIKIVKENDDEVILEQSEDNPISEDNDITLRFKSFEGESLKIRFNYIIKKEKKKAKKEIDEDVDYEEI